MDEQFHKVVAAAASEWLPVAGGDPNTIDLWWLARGIERQLETSLPTNLPTNELGVVLIDDCVEKKFIKEPIRLLPTSELVAGAWDALECATSKGFREVVASGDSRGTALHVAWLHRNGQMPAEGDLRARALHARDEAAGV